MVAGKAAVPPAGDETAVVGRTTGLTGLPGFCAGTEVGTAGWGADGPAGAAVGWLLLATPSTDDPSVGTAVGDGDVGWAVGVVALPPEEAATVFVGVAATDVAVAGAEVAVGGIGVLVAGTEVEVGGTDVFVAAIDVDVAGTRVLVDVGGTAVLVAGPETDTVPNDVDTCERFPATLDCLPTRTSDVDCTCPLPAPTAFQFRENSGQLPVQVPIREAATWTELLPMVPASRGMFQAAFSWTDVGTATAGLKLIVRSNPFSSSAAARVTLAVVENDCPDWADAPLSDNWVPAEASLGASDTMRAPTPNIAMAANVPNRRAIGLA
ncbi:MAG: hypothetical protein AB7N24_20570 [Dehalococcoidia bacterium]